MTNPHKFQMTKSQGSTTEAPSGPTRQNTPCRSPLLVCAALIIEQDQILLSLRPEGKPQGGYWELPGGKIEAGESPTEALQREFREELGGEISVEDIFEVLYHQLPLGPVLLLVYHCRLLSHQLENLEVAEHQWVPLSQLERWNLLPADRTLIPKIKSLSIKNPPSMLK